MVKILKPVLILAIVIGFLLFVNSLNFPTQDKAIIYIVIFLFFFLFVIYFLYQAHTEEEIDMTFQSY